MKIAIFSALDRASRSGNWVTASRWQRLLRSAGHRVSILHDEAEAKASSAEVLIGLHARRCSKALIQFKRNNPSGKTLIAFTGTDVYGDLAPSRKHPPALAIRALNECDHVIALQPLMLKRLKRQWRAKSSVVMMDVAPRMKQQRSTDRRDSPLKACVIGHMRYEKDPLRAAMAIRSLPGQIEIEVTHAGKAMTDSFQKRATREAQTNANWHWVGSIAWQQAQRLMKTSDLLINSSRAEGAPNVLFEAIGWQLPVLASRIDGHVGILGNDYPGFFGVGETAGLRKLLIRCHNDKAFYRRLVGSINSLAKKYKPGNELKSLSSAITKAYKP